MANDGRNSVLIACDERSNHESLLKILSPEYAVYAAQSGLSAIAMAHNNLPDVILLDTDMPDMDGYDALGALKKSEKTRNIPVILITEPKSGEEEKGFDLEAADYIYKPFSASIVKTRIRNQIKLNNQIRIEEKNKFFARMSHEMRTPLNAVIGMAEMTLETGGLSEEARRNVEKIGSAGASLLDLVNDVLDISKIEAGKFKFTPVEYDTAAMINDAAVQSVMRKGEKPVEFRLNIDENLPKRLYGDDLRIKQILNNLLSNAFKYTKEGTVELIIKAAPQGDVVWLIASVMDTGIGIKSGNLGAIFSDYAQMDINANRKIEGTGLGLSITKMMVDIMGGRIFVESEYGKGSLFKVEIPQKIAAAETLGPQTVSKLKSFHYQASREKQLQRISLPYARVLVVDDIMTNLDVAKGLMKPYRMQIDCVSGGQQAIDLIREGKIRYNAIFMDHIMPLIDGIEAARIIREDIGTEYAKTIPIIAFTANALAGNEEMFLGKGFNAFISKPVNIYSLDAVIKRWVRDKEMEKTSGNRQILIDGEIVFDSRTGYERRSARGDRRRGYDRRLLTSGIRGLDISRGIERFAGVWETYLDILKSFALNTRPLLDAIKDADSSGYIAAIHGIKGSCRGICAEELGNQAQALEKAARAGDNEYIRNNNQLFIETALKLITEIENVLPCKMEIKKIIKKDRPDADVLCKLSQACGECKTADIEALFKEIEIYEYEQDSGLVQWLRENINQMNYGKITEKLSVLSEVN
ncbi:MAG: response regulator [Treponema sp.]|jgi:signal transduction histidine kinase/HPt (histidine-containing phosphotransfer) domain-containing protein|nr:response regulator [Treponema sp.]